MRPTGSWRDPPCDRPSRPAGRPTGRGGEDVGLLTDLGEGLLGVLRQVLLAALAAEEDGLAVDDLLHRLAHRSEVVGLALILADGADLLRQGRVAILGG